MAISLAVMCLALALANAEMRETMERMIMVRTSGSDLQPAATGYIYKSDGEGPANIIKLEESDVIKHLEAMPAIYDQPEAFAAPIPVASGPFYAQKDQSFAKSQAYTIPVYEVTSDESSHDAVGAEDFTKFGDDGGYLADFDKAFADHAGDFGHFGGHHGHHQANADYFGGHHENGGGNDHNADHYSTHGDKGSKGYESHHEYGKGDAGDYAKKHQEGFHVQGGGDKKSHFDEASSYGSEYASGKGYKGEDHGHKKGHSKGEKTTGFHNVYDKDEFKKDHDFYDDAHKKGDFHKHGSEASHRGSAAGGFKKGGSHDSGYDHGDFGKHGFANKGHIDSHDHGYASNDDGKSYHHHHSDVGSTGGAADGKQSGFEHKH